MEKQRDIRKTVLSQMKIPGETREFFEELTIPVIAEWAYLCITEGMPLEKLRMVCAAAESNTAKANLIFMEERERNLREKYEDNEKLKEEYTDLLHRVEIMYERTSALEEGLNGKLTDAMQEKDRAFAQAVQIRDVVIRDKEKQVSELKKEMVELKKEIVDLKKENKELIQKYDGEREKVYSLENRLKTAEIRLSSAMKNDDRKPSGEEKKAPAEDPGHRVGSDGREAGSESDEEKIRVFPYHRYGYPVKRYRGRRSIFNKGDREADEFIRLYIDNKDYSKAQKEFLIECLEQGDPLHVIKKFASPGLSVYYMSEMRRLIYERGY